MIRVLTDIDVPIETIKAYADGGKTPETLMKQVAKNVKQRHLENRFTQQQLSSKAGITLSSYRRFEQSGEISLRNLALLAMVLNVIDEFNTLFSNKNYNSIDDVINESKTPKRGRKNEKY
jgi:transcriptional regulator with XRE-family HTH domain